MEGCCGALCRELDIRNLALKYRDPRAFTESSALPLPIFILYRATFTCIFVAALTFVGLKHPEYTIILHFSYWSLGLTALYFLVGTLASLWHSTCTKCSGRGSYGALLNKSDTSCALEPWEDDESEPEDNEPNMLSWQHEVLWVLHTISIDSSLVLVVAYFSMWYDPDVNTVSGLLDIPHHAFPFILLVVDVFVSGIPVRILHVIYGNVFGAAYVVFCLVYIITEVPDMRSDPRTYPSLMFSDRPVIYTAWLSIFILGGFFVSQCLFYLFYKIRVSLAIKPNKL
ncbi:protein rolling stone isoform X1 [Nematostella vectensis]|uniref:protein rolling stone isoform X1 n=1 Tax=Nematostella vectensis TaxID=45351 RepID=UPI002077708E|nr:protein rolling stone isoform X1 [Nematostella vectensis]